MNNLNMGMITAQNPANQSKMYFNYFTEEKLTTLGENLDKYNLEHSDSNQLKVNGKFVINYLKRCDEIISKGRMSDDSKEFVKGVVPLLAMFISDDWFSVPYEHTAEHYYPDDLWNELENGEADKDELIEDAIEEISNITGDWFSALDSNSPYKKEEWDDAMEIINEYRTFIKQNDGEIPDWVDRDTKELSEINNKN